LYAQKIDTIYHINGNVLTGDFKHLKYGVVTWKMDGMGTINFEEVKIRTILSRKQFKITLKNDLIYYGSFSPSEKNRTVYIVMPNKKELVDVDQIVEVYPIRRNFWMRTSGNFSLGFNYSKGSDIASLAFSGDVSYRKKVTYLNLTWDNNNTFQSDSLSATNLNFGLAWQRTIKKGWSTETSISGSQNTELGTKMRWQLNLLGLKDIFYSDWHRLYAGTGFSGIHEIPFGVAPAQDDIAAVFQLVWKVYKLTSPKVWVDADISYVPYLTDNRYRTVFNLSPKVRIINNNFTIGGVFYYNYDSNPGANANSNSDYGLNLQLSYLLH